MSGFLFGPLGGMVSLPWVSRNVPVEYGRAQVEHVSAGGVRSVMRGRFAPRSWTLSKDWGTPELVRALSAAAHGLLGPCWLYDVAAARENMLPASRCAGTGMPVLVDGLPMGALTAGHTVQVPVLAGRSYTFSAWSAAAPGATVATYQVDAGPIVPVLAPPGSGARYAGAGFEASADAIVTITVPGAGVSGLRLHEGLPDGAWLPGHGTPCRVSVNDPGRVLQLVTATESRSSYSVVLQEVGRPGVI